MEKIPIDARVPFRKSRVRGALGRVGRWTLVVIVLGLALIGFLHLTRGTAVRHVRGVSADGTPIAVGEPEFPLMATMATGAWLAPGNRVEVLLNGDGTYPRLWEDLRSATQSITLQLDHGAPGRIADRLGQILIERAKAGVRVLGLYDAFGTGTSRQAIATRSEPRASWSSHSGRFGSPHSISHRIARTFGASSSTVVSDGPEASASTTNGFGDGRTNGSWRETNVRFEGPAVRQLQAAFVAAWVESTGVMLTIFDTPTRSPSPRSSNDRGGTVDGACR